MVAGKKLPKHVVVDVRIVLKELCLL